MKIIWASCIVLGATLGCSSTNKLSEVDATTESRSPQLTKNYTMGINSYSDGDANYTGLYNTFEYRATLLNSAVHKLVLNQQAKSYLWDEEKLSKEDEKNQKKMADFTEIFLSFYTPERKNDNLTDAKSIWRVYLDVGGRRYTGKVKRDRSLLAEIQALFPYHTRWNTAYRVSFPIPTATVDTQNSQVTITGPLGTKTVNFSAMPQTM